TDQVWHLHMLYTESYWKDFCEKTLEREIHHGPTKGGTQEAEKFTDWYARTLEMYRAVFLSEPPADLWPDPEKRFGHTHYRWINRQTTWCIRKPQFLIGFQKFIVKHLKRRTM
ncbi:MAG: glycine-rich domain-containing protein, partial [Bacteroidia bacterium]